METPRSNSRDAVASIATHEPCNVARTLTRVACRWTKRCRKSTEAQHFVKVSSPLRTHRHVGYHLALYLEQTCGSRQEHSMKSPAHRQKHLGATGPEANPPKERL